jgi:membrane protease YdiL (CAAX protease family)
VVTTTESPKARPPLENPAWNGWDVLVVVGLALATIFVSQIAILIVAHYLLYPHVKLTDLAQRPILLLLSQFVIDGGVVVYLFLLVEGKYHQRFWQAIRWNWPKGMWAMLALGASTYLVLAMLGSLLPMPKSTPFDNLFQNRRDAFLLAIIATTLGPLMEELFFRGFFYPVVAKRWGAGWGIFLSALPFALMHMQQYGYSWGILLLIFGVGLVCGIVRAVTGSVAASFLVHVGYNGAQMLIAIFLTHGFTRMPKGLLECFSG